MHRYLKSFLVILLLAFVSPIVGEENEPTMTFDLGSEQLRFVRTWQYRFGDNDEWGRTDYDDSEWETIQLVEWIPDSVGIHWFRTRTYLKGDSPAGKTLTLRFVGLYSAFEVFLNGLPIGQNGRVGKNKEEEIPGLIHKMLVIEKDRILPGENVLAIRISNQRKTTLFANLGVIVSYLSDWQAYASRVLHLHFLMIGVLVTTLILSLALYFGGGKHRSFLIFGSYCLSSASAYVVAPLIEYSQLKVTVLDYLLSIQYINNLIVPIIWIVFILVHFELPRKTIHILITISVVILFKMIAPLEIGVDLGSIITVIYALVLLFYAINHKKAGSTIAFIGVLTLVIPESIFLINKIFQTQIPSFRGEYFVIPFVFCVTLSISRQIREENLIHDEAVKRSHRLETELLKKTIQPHFIMNTLVSIISLIGEDPRKAVRLIKALADEFRAINRISSNSLITIGEEIALCRTHLDLMGLRMDAQYSLVTEGIDEEDLIPPMLFHTLVENGLSHAFDVKENGHFYITCESTEKCKTYRVRNDGSLLKKFVLKTNAEIEEGLGLHYVRARLEESFSSGWFLDYGVKNGEWVVQITID